MIEVDAVEHLVGHWRRRYDPSSRQGVPAHITVLYPFQEPASIDQHTMAALSRLAASVERSPFTLSAVEEFPGVVWLRPSPDEWFREFTRMLTGRFPECRPYRGAFPDPQPHLTVGQFTDADAQQRMHLAFHSEIAAMLPLQCHATMLSLYVSDSSGAWSLANRFPFR